MIEDLPELSGEQLDRRADGGLLLPLSGSPVFGSALEQRDDIRHPGPLSVEGGRLELEGEGTLHEEWPAGRGKHSSDARGVWTEGLEDSTGTDP